MSFRLMPYVTSLAGPFVLLAAIACGEAQTLSVNPVPLELSNEARYRVQVNGTSVPVLQVGLNVYAVSFDFTGKAEMQVDVEESDLNLEGSGSGKLSTNRPCITPTTSKETRSSALYRRRS